MKNEVQTSKKNLEGVYALKQATKKDLESGSLHNWNYLWKSKTNSIWCYLGKNILKLGGGLFHLGGGLPHLGRGLLQLGRGLFKLGRKRFRLIPTICQVPETMLAIDKIYCARVC